MPKKAVSGSGVGSQKSSTTKKSAKGSNMSGKGGSRTTRAKSGY